MLAKPVFPSELLIEVTNDCNLRCLMCPRSKMTRKIGYMPFTLFCRVIDQIRHLPATIITLHGLGEPLLHPEIVKMVSYAKNSHMQRVNFNTNGSLLTDGLSEKLINSGLDELTLSMDSATARCYSPGTEGAFSSLDKKITGLINLRNKLSVKKPKIKLQIIDTDLTKSLTGSFIRRWQGKADQLIIKKLMSWSGSSRAEKKTHPSPRIACANQILQAVIQWNGQVISCCLSKENFMDTGISLGNLRNSSLKEIFLGKNRQAVLKEHFRGDYRNTPSCQNCGEWVDYFAPFFYGKGKLRQRLHKKILKS